MSINSIPSRKHSYSIILKISPPKTEGFQIKNSDIDIFHISAQNIDCGYSIEPPRSYFCSKHRLRVLVRNASPRRFYRAPTIYVLSFE